MTTTLSTGAAGRFFVALPGNGEFGIYSSGRTVDVTLAKAYRDSQTLPADVCQNEDGEWVVSCQGDSETFRDEDEAREYAGELGFVAHPCTERLYIHVERYGYNRNEPSFRYASGTNGLIDLDLGDSEVALDDAVDEVLLGFHGLSYEAQDEWTAETALIDAHDYVHAYVIEGDKTRKWGYLADERTPFRTALDLRVRDIILDRIEAR
ncbi:hypothetical protein [Methylobacterium nonmethylotrophicum]|uniref:Uncharacterized protein n=1 Tax=Methylobacterium nonmethylotrophicum TaxID=1141884 RepID=A0A4Z0NID3_9HYPH|nr:hypothetical protein [Methylobacterium nonmethylotrophicum]TGD95243.1 hypothetical protein EU555_28680 [Methylobacterium nonmethylotrophicum]